MPEGNYRKYQKTDIFEEYLDFVMDIISRYSDSVNLINEHDEITPADLNYALAQYLPTNVALIAEYQRVKIESFKIKTEYQKWYDERFIAIRQEMQEKVSKSIKISVSEMDTELRVRHADDYKEWQSKLSVADSQVSFFKRMLEQYKKFDNILTTISQNMRQELYSLSVENRMNADPTTNKVRSRSPKIDE